MNTEPSVSAAPLPTQARSVVDDAPNTNGPSATPPDPTVTASASRPAASTVVQDAVGARSTAAPADSLAVPVRPEPIVTSTDLGGTLASSVPPVPARALSTSLHKSNSLPLPLPSVDTDGSDGRQSTAEIRSQPPRQTTPPPPSVSHSHQTPVAKPSSERALNEPTPGLSQGTASPSSPVVSTPLGGGVGLGFVGGSIGRSGRGAANWEMEGDALVDPNAVFVVSTWLDPCLQGARLCLTRDLYRLGPTRVDSTRSTWTTPGSDPSLASMGPSPISISSTTRQRASQRSLSSPTRTRSRPQLPSQPS